MSEQDHYCYSGSEVLRNLFDLRNQADLAKAEAKVSVLRLDQLRKSPVAGKFDLGHLQTIHQRIFRDIYPWAGELRTVSMSKGGSLFCRYEFISNEGERIFSQLKGESVLRGLSQDKFCERLAYYFGEINALHPFREGNGRTQRVMLDTIAKQAGYEIDFQQILRETMISISRDAQVGQLETATACFKTAVRSNEVHRKVAAKERSVSSERGR